MKYSTCLLNCSPHLEKGFIYIFRWQKSSTIHHTLSFFQDMGDDAAALFAALTLRCGQLRTLRSLFVTRRWNGLAGWKIGKIRYLIYTVWVDVVGKLWEMFIYRLLIPITGPQKCEDTPCILWHPLVPHWCFRFPSWQLTNFCFGYTPSRLSGNAIGDIGARGS